ncbi:MAG: VWA domain-containing protein, partial [Planctomycetes bacterium]|nr:VWA domain-containing protein [Planctomycetota bacterium]
MIGTTNLLLAISFAQPWMLWGLAAVAVPIVLHFLRRQPVQEMDWAAMRFLLAALRKHARRRRLEEYLLLTARVLVLALLVLALAGPAAETPRSVRPTSQPTHFIIAIDDSFSMAYRPSGPRVSVSESGARNRSGNTVFDRAKQTVRRIVAASRPGDRFSLIRFCGPDRVLIEQPTPSPEAVLRTIASLEVSDQRADVLSLSESLVSVVRLTETSFRKHVVVISDFQRVDWQPTSDSGLTLLRENFRKLSGRAAVALIDVGQEQAWNGALVDLVADRVFVTTGQPVTLTARVRWFAPRDAGRDTDAGKDIDRGDTVQLYVDGRLRDTTSIQPGPIREAQVQFQLAMGEEGDRVIEVRAPPDALPVDNRRWLVLPVRRSLRVLLVDGRPVGTPEEAATYFVERALTPKRADGSRASVIQTSVIRDDQLVERTLSDYDCIFLCDVPVLTGDDLRALREYVRAGGGVIIALGPNVDAAAYNAATGPDGLLPAPLGEIVGDPTRPERVFVFDVGSDNHPVLDAFRGNP